ncbi:phosphoribosylaminoimidazolesuccinocarboxamide synthase [Defluviicoccus vanus]|uniref:Phosphoribosylaminoimidazole-succinocarboxamide synthase n=1 Tax=Defluviicoccus vanus TaxID=111831 RepID=A0A7H1MYW4_9PROT|nr:phosphoribosylaminoimidazolesuccinocarboxamide synthase [Defluviicoccus vanus]QNT68650.1 phosphoribosylaminoimidazolesuccinocarboxamide synthase [Defluviicoccus vanus]
MSSDFSTTIAARLDDTLTDAAFTDIPGHSRGKVRDNYDLADGRRILIATDRQSAFDQVLAAVPFKGQVLTATARFWFEATADIAPNHVLAFPDPNVTVAKRLAMLPVEVVVRDYLTGSTATSIWPMYRAGGRSLYGYQLPDGLRINQQLPQTLITPTTKGADGRHDEPITAAEIVERGLLPQPVWDEVAALALSLFARGRAIAAERGLILVDTKYEFGLDAEGRVVLADEVHTPDSSRYWRAATYVDRFSVGDEPEALDKDFLRRWIIARCDPYHQPIPVIPAETLIAFSQRYITLYEIITGASFVPPPPTPPLRARIYDNLQRYLAGSAG